MHPPESMTIKRLVLRKTRQKAQRSLLSFFQARRRGEQVPDA
jgi:hypothetical protein